MKIKLLFVCTGGICRSPMAVGVFSALAARAGIGHLVEVDSAGTYNGNAGRPPPLPAIEAAMRRGYDISDARARQLMTEDVIRFDYPLAMDRTQLASMRWLAPGGLTEKPRLLMKYASSPGVTDIVDPYGGTTRDYERALDLIELGCRGLLNHFGQTSQPRSIQPLVDVDAAMASMLVATG